VLTSHFIQFTRDSSPPEDIEILVAESEAPTEADSDDFIIVGGKRIPSSSYDPRCVALRNEATWNPNHSIHPEA
jgi:hypothetical protein